MKLSSANCSAQAQEVAIGYWNERNKDEIERDEKADITEIDYVEWVMAELSELIAAPKKYYFSGDTLFLSSGATLDMDQVQSICTGNAGNRATDTRIREYLQDEGWGLEDVNEFMQAITELESK